MEGLRLAPPNEREPGEDAAQLRRSSQNVERNDRVASQSAAGRPEERYAPLEISKPKGLGRAARHILWTAGAAGGKAVKQRTPKIAANLALGRMVPGADRCRRGATNRDNSRSLERDAGSRARPL